MIDQNLDTQLQPYKRLGPFLIAGLGNPGRKFEHNRHNVGFMLLNRLSLKFDVTFGQVESKALVAKTIYQGERVILIKPQTYMNNSGSAVNSLVNFYKIPLAMMMLTCHSESSGFVLQADQPGKMACSRSLSAWERINFPACESAQAGLPVRWKQPIMY
jgi:hypothetical protein